MKSALFYRVKRRMLNSEGHGHSHHVTVCISSILFDDYSIKTTEASSNMCTAGANGGKTFRVCPRVMKREQRPTVSARLIPTWLGSFASGASSKSAEYVASSEKRCQHNETAMLAQVNCTDYPTATLATLAARKSQLCSTKR